MKVFKFGGASVKDAESVRNVAEVLKHFALDDLMIVVSAMGKVTNTLEAVVWKHCDGRSGEAIVKELQSIHGSILDQVAPDDASAAEALSRSFSELMAILDTPNDGQVDRTYDRIVPFGEMWSTIIVSAYLNSVGMTNTWMDVREMIRTDSSHRSARVDWDASAKACSDAMHAVRDMKPMRAVTQGFIGQSTDGDTTTLGREGSDLTAAIFGYLLDAESVTIWKDVAGMFNADPNKFQNTRLLSHISYREAIELSYFGASVIHPRTLQPLQHKNIPLYVRSFKDLKAVGSTISEATDHDTLVPSYIIKPMQLLISITPRDLSFIVEENLSGIFKTFAQHNVRIELMQNSAVAFSVAVDDTPRARQLIEELRSEYEVRYNAGCELLTIRHYDEGILVELTRGKEILIEQRSRVTARYVMVAPSQ